MKNQPINYDAFVRNAHKRRDRALTQFWSKLISNLSPRLPKILHHDD